MSRFVRLIAAVGLVLVCSFPMLGCKPRVLVVGLDGASWKILDPLMQMGYAPNIANLVRNGVKADLDCEPASPFGACFCPPVWMTIMTGQPALVHRIFNFPDPSTQRRAPTIWDLNSAFGGRNTLLSLHNMWPPDPTADVEVTESGIEVFASALYDVVDPVPTGPSYDDPRDWTRPPGLLGHLGLAHAARGGPAWKPMAMDRVSMEMLTRIAFEKRDVPGWERTTELDIILLHSPDRSMHMMWPTIQAHPFDPIDTESLRRIADEWTGPVSYPPPFQWGTVASQLIEADRQIGRLLATISYDYVFLLSDHGMANNPIPGAFPPGHHNTPEAWNGIFAVWGPGIVRRGVTLPKLSVFDVAPTLAYLLGIPIADDLPGRFVDEAIEPAILNLHPGPRIASWQPFLPRR